jgi:RND superfamily putative drug exporter
MDRFFTSLGRAAVRHRRPFILLWVGLLAFGLAFAPRLQEVFDREQVSGNTGDSKAAAEVVVREFSNRRPLAEQLVLVSDSKTVDDPAYRDAAMAALDAAMATGTVAEVDGFFQTGDRTSVSPDGRTTFMTLYLYAPNRAEGMAAARKLLDAVAAAPPPSWLKAHLTGTEAIFADTSSASEKSINTAEAVGIPIALLVLILVFGALVAGFLPLLIGMVTIVIALALAFIVGQAMDLSVFIKNIATMLGLGLGIDYSLFILTRYRGERRAGRSVDDAVVETVRHAGKAIAFSGLTVAIGLAALLAAGEPTVVSIGVGGLLVAFVAVAAALTLMPALIAVLGDRIEQPRWLGRIVRRGQRDGFWGRWARAAMNRPYAFLALGLIVVGALALPALSLERVANGVTLLGRDAQSRQGFEALARDFGPGTTSPVQVVVRTSGSIGKAETIAGIAELTAAIAADPRFVQAVSITTVDPRLTLDQYQAMYANDFAGVPAEMRPGLGKLVNLDRGGNTAMILGILRGDPLASDAPDTIRALRETIVPSIASLRDATVLVGGTTASEMDLSDGVYERLPIMIGISLVATFLLLVVLFRSIVIPLKAVVMNLLSVAAAYGLLVLAFQWGNAAALFDFTPIGAVNWMTPVLLFAILFGLSMDYEVFLLSRIRELHDRGMSNEEAIAGGIERTGGVITGAALIMIVIFASFILSPILIIKELGFGLAAAVFIDATVVRIILVPAVMRLLGNSAWWLPGRLGRLLPTVQLEPEVGVAGTTTEQDDRLSVPGEVATRRISPLSRVPNRNGDSEFVRRSGHPILLAELPCNRDD